MLEADEPKLVLELAGWELEELYQALVLKREVSRIVPDVDDYCLIDRIEGLLNTEAMLYCLEKVQQYTHCLARIFIEYGRLEQFQYDHKWGYNGGSCEPKSAPLRGAPGQS